MSSSGQLSGHEEREPISPAIPEEGVYEVKYENRRTNVVRLLPNGFQERKLRKLADTSARLFNEVNYERRQQFFQQHQVDFQGTSQKYYEKYKGILGSANAQQVLNKNNEAWSSFFSLLNLKKKGKLPPHMNHVSPPRYWKKEKKRKLLLVIRQDRYEVDEKNHKLVLRDFNLEIEFSGRLRWYGKQGRLEIYYDDVENAWYASIPVEVGVEETKTGKKSKYIVRGERKTIQISPKGNKVASIDLGINVLASVVVNDGTWLLYKGVRIKQDYFYLQRKIAEEQSLADKARNLGLVDNARNLGLVDNARNLGLVDNARNLGLVDNARNLGLVDNARNLGLVDNARNLGEYEAQEEHNREKRRLFEKLTRRLLHLYRNLASDLLKRLHDQGVSIIYLGYPYNIAQDRGNKFTANLWLYRMLMNAIELKAQEYGMKVYEVVEYNTSKYCAYHNVEVSRRPRGVVTCPKGHKLHSDLNGALNILKKAVGIAISTVKKPLSFLVLHNGVAPVKGCNT